MINWERVFKDVGNIDHERTLALIRKVIVRRMWTDVLEEIFDSMLREEEGPENFARRTGVDIEHAKSMYDHGYLALRRMAQDGWIQPIMLGAINEQD